MNFYELPKDLQKEILDFTENRGKIKEVILERNGILERLNITSIIDTLEGFIIKCK